MRAKIVAVLHDARGRAVCDACLAASLGIACRSVERVTTSLPRCGDFVREHASVCSICREATTATRTVLLPRALTFTA